MFAAVRHSASVVERLRLVVAAFAAACATVVVADRAGLRLNVTGSVPIGLYRVAAVAPARLTPGVLVAVCLDPTIARVGLERGYLRPGRCPSGHQPLLKEVALADSPAGAVFTEGGLVVDGRLLEGTTPLRADRHGRALRHFLAGPVDLRRALWLRGSSPYSWDSRYIGPQPQSAVIATATPVLLLEDAH